MTEIADRLAALDWDRIASALDETGGAATGPLLAPEECARPARRLGRGPVSLARGHAPARLRLRRVPLFRRPVAAGRGRATRGGLPPPAPIANAWAERLGDEFRAPATLDEMLARCHAAGQRRPTPLLLAYGAGDYNCLHQDLYGAVAFPLQLVVQLSEPGTDFTGGEFVLVEQRPRMQSRPTVLDPRPRPRRRLRDEPQAPPGDGSGRARLDALGAAPRRQPSGLRRRA